jgi:hypothetical protein
VATDAERLSTELLRVADRLVEDFAEVPAGSVLRCLARAVHMVRVRGSAPEDLGTRAEELARHMLRDRGCIEDPVAPQDSGAATSEE